MSRSLSTLSVALEVAVADLVAVGVADTVGRWRFASWLRLELLVAVGVELADALVCAMSLSAVVVGVELAVVLESGRSGGRGRCWVAVEVEPSGRGRGRCRRRGRCQSHGRRMEWASRSATALSQPIPMSLHFLRALRRGVGELQQAVFELANLRRRESIETEQLPAGESAPVHPLESRLKPVPDHDHGRRRHLDLALVGERDNLWSASRSGRHFAEIDLLDR